MKKATALLIALLMLMSVAQAAEWENGTSPEQPYEGVPKVDLSEVFGYLMLDPSEGLAAEHFCQKLLIYTPREDVEASDATFYLCSETKRDGAIWSTPMNDTDVVTMRPITEEELVGLMWGSGTCFEVLLPESLTLGQDYFVNMEEGCLVSHDGVKSPTIGGTDEWTFTMEGDYGVSALQYRRPRGNGYEEGVLNPTAGDEIRFDLVLGGEAESAVIYRRNDAVDFEDTIIEQSGEVIGQVTGDNPIWGVQFLDAQGNLVDRIEFR